LRRLAEAARGAEIHAFAQVSRQFSNRRPRERRRMGLQL